jgi:hypothetical protein
VGLEITANHLARRARRKCDRYRQNSYTKGRTTHVWDIRVHDEGGELVRDLPSHQHDHRPPMSSEPALRLALRYCISEGITFAVFRVTRWCCDLWAQQTPDLDRCENGMWWELNDVFLLSPFRAPIVPR